MAEIDDHLEPFLLMAKSNKGAAAAKISRDATAAPGVYGFGELLDVPNVKELKIHPDHASSHRLLELFAYGNLSTYATSKGDYPELIPAQITKLKHLTLIDLCLHSRSLSYADLATSLEVSSVRDLEDLIIDAMYSSLLGGKLDQKEGVLSVDWVVGRDVNREDQSLTELQNKLESWCNNTQSILDSIDQQIVRAKADSSRNRQQQQDYVVKRNALYSAKYEDKFNKKANDTLPAASQGLGQTAGGWEMDTDVTDTGSAPSKGRKAFQDGTPMKRQKSQSNDLGP